MKSRNYYTVVEKLKYYSVVSSYHNKTTIAHPRALDHRHEDKLRALMPINIDSIDQEKMHEIEKSVVN